MPRLSIRARFWAKVEARSPDECWEWTASRQKLSGRGQFSVGGTPRPAHYVAYELAGGTILQDHDVTQTCGNIGCVNPAHLEHRRRPTTEERFWEKVQRGSGDGCWLWTGGVNGRYGVFRVDNATTIGAHRFSYEAAHGLVPGAMQVLHRCDTPLCVNPGHLFLGSIRDNMDDRNAKGRQARGERHRSAKLTENAVLSIRQRRLGGESILDIADEYMMIPAAIRQAARGITWKYLWCGG